MIVAKFSLKGKTGTKKVYKKNILEPDLDYFSGLHSVGRYSPSLVRSDASKSKKHVFGSLA